VGWEAGWRGEAVGIRPVAIVIARGTTRRTTLAVRELVQWLFLGVVCSRASFGTECKKEEIDL
jgi:hypothetical protein